MYGVDFYLLVGAGVSWSEYLLPLGQLIKWQSTAVRYYYSTVFCVLANYSTRSEQKSYQQHKTELREQLTRRKAANSFL